MTAPKLPDEKFVCTAWNSVWLSVLKDSKRICSVAPSLFANQGMPRKFLNRLASRLRRPGPRRDPLVALRER